MKISFNQPAFIPWGGFFARLMSSDRMVLLDETVLGRGFTYVNRNRVKGSKGEIWLTVPLKRKGRGAQKIRDLEIYEKQRWVRKFLLTLRHFYGHSVHFDEIFGEIHNAVASSEESFLDLAMPLLEILRRHLAIGTEMVLQSKTGIMGKGTDLLVALAKELGAAEVILPYFSEKAVEVEKFRREKMDVRFLRYDPPPYPQFWGEFAQNLSALDLLLCCGKDGRRVIEKGIVSPRTS
ncbi:MAG: WbqC family protein [Acidobacteriota bacterium]